MSRLTIIAVLLISSMMLSACGQKGPLVAPSDLDGEKTVSSEKAPKEKTSDFLLD